MKILKGIAVMLFVAVAAVGQVTSVYTPLDDKKCKTIEATDEEGGSYHGECPGTAGYKLELIEGDLRQTITVVDPKRKKYPLEFWNLTGAFNAVGQTAEWRMRGKKPIALIVRLNVNEALDDPARVKSYLIVSKILPDAACVVAMVPPSKTQNVDARRLADRSATAKCGGLELTTSRILN
ncbi:MAG: hypothetical protein ABL984_18940 [Pyrinomonadaceae bacterium]